MTIHELKCLPEFYVLIQDGTKKFEVRFNDRGFKLGDVLLLREWLQDSGEYTRNVMLRRVTYVLYGGQFGIEKGFCVLGIEPVE